MGTTSRITWFPRSLHLRPAPTSTVHHFHLADFSPSIFTRLLILQPTPFCNINCDYCYLPNRNSTMRMDIKIVRRAAERLRDDGLVGEELTVAWHAGEPLAMPLSFYKEAIKVFQDVLGSACNVSHSIQTNATLINDAWCEFFKKKTLA
jgi:uncharacterized protein